MFQSDKIDALAGAIVAAQAEFEAVAKTTTNPFFKSKYADLPSIVKYASKILSTHGLAVVQSLGMTGNHDTLTTRLLHSSGQYLEDTMRLHLPKEDPQGHGSATTYARRYAYMAILGLVADVDDDDNAAQSSQRPQWRSGRPHSAALPGTEAAPDWDDEMERSFPGAEPVDDGYSDQPPPSSASVSDPMNKRIYALCRTNNRDSSAEASRILGHRITDTRTLTRQQAKKVLDQLDAEGVKFAEQG